jgi:hypothetical protein
VIQVSEDKTLTFGTPVWFWNDEQNLSGVIVHTFYPGELEGTQHIQYVIMEENTYYVRDEFTTFTKQGATSFTASILRTLGSIKIV